MKKKLLIVILFCLASAAVVSANEVINIDLNNYNDNTPYTGTAAYNDGINKWNVYFGGWGKPMGSSRTMNLAAYNEPCMPSTYAAQVWIGDPGVDHNYVSGSGLMGDGFINNPAIAGDPNIRLWGQGAYGGTFDIYVYGSAAGSFTLTRGSTVIGTKTVTGGVAAGQFVEGGNYVIFPGVDIANDPNVVRIKYSNVINGLQLVKIKSPVAIADGVQIDAGAYDVAYEINKSGDSQVFGPDIGTDPYNPGYHVVGYVAPGEYMQYDVTMDELNEGEYNVYLLVDTRNTDATGWDLYFNDMSIGSVTAPYTGDVPLSATTTATVNIFGKPGVQSIKWRMGGSGSYQNVAAVAFQWLGPVNMPNCDSVYKYGFQYTGDLNKDCKVDLKDIKLMTDQWMNCYDPNTHNCP